MTVPMPEKDHFHIEEIAGRWQWEEKDVLFCGGTGELPITFRFVIRGGPLTDIGLTRRCDRDVAGKDHAAAFTNQNAKVAAVEFVS